MGKRELIALLNLSSWCLVMVERLFLTVPRGCLQFVIVVFPDHTHLLFLTSLDRKFLPRSDTILIGAPNRQKISSCRTLAIVTAVWSCNGNASTHLEKLSTQTKINSCPAVVFLAMDQVYQCAYVQTLWQQEEDLKE